MVLKRYQNRSVWHRWYAWHPVHIDLVGWVWLQDVERRQVPYKGSHYWSYRCS